MTAAAATNNFLANIFLFLCKNGISTYTHARNCTGVLDFQPAALILLQSVQEKIRDGTACHCLCESVFPVSTWPDGDHGRGVEQDYLQAEPAAVRAAIRGGYADSKIVYIPGRRMLEHHFVAGGQIKTQLKDMHNILDAAQCANLTMPLTQLVSERYAAIAHDYS